MLDIDQLEEMRTDTLDSLPELGWVLREASIEDGAGGLDVAWSRTTVTALPLRVAPATGSSRSMFYKIGEKPLIEPTHILTLQQGVSVLPSDKIETSTGRTFTIVSLANTRSFQIFTRILCKELS